MLETAFLRNRPEEARQRLAKRNIDVEGLLAKAAGLDEQRRGTQQQLDAELAAMNEQARAIGELVKAGKREEAEGAKAKTAERKERIARLKEELAMAEKALDEHLWTLPNTPQERVPNGKTPEDNVTVVQKGTLPQLPATAKPHWDLGAEYGLFSLEDGVKLTGAGFPVYHGPGAKLQRALIAFFLDRAIAAGYEEVMPPLLVNADSAFATGQLPDKEGQMYHATADDLFLIPTAEVPITNLYRDSILDLAQLPVKRVGHTPCFRREAGSYGKDVRGLNRVHQFDKVEIVRIEAPANSNAALEDMADHVKGLLDALELPWRQLLLCGGDMGFTSAITYDMEVYAGAQQRWLEVSSISNFETFQSNRLKLRFRGADKKVQLAHTLNGSALALARIVAALLENNQTPEGIRIPAALRPYTGFDLIAKK
ncbi:MAG: serine--tRNA ligase [Flavobacteriales bacterium]|nr:serine--tRNA ligase [Flavobacteriales bacterium]MBP9079451.1 serine--tRNA ligase [Flavobacteriales bacterium]